jgi:AsmA protein
MLPDPQSLIRRSGAAAPLLDAAKTHNASDAVRAVIDQLLTSPPAPTSTPAVSPALAPAAPKASE